MIQSLRASLLVMGLSGIVAQIILNKGDILAEIA